MNYDTPTSDNNIKASELILGKTNILVDIPLHRSIKRGIQHKILFNKKQIKNSILRLIKRERRQRRRTRRRK